MFIEEWKDEVTKKKCNSVFSQEGDRFIAVACILKQQFKVLVKKVIYRKNNHLM